MNAARLSLVIMASALLTIGLGGMAYAFHSGGVAECEGCHSMHSPAPGGSYLLIGASASETCLSCHEHAGDTGPSSYHISTASADIGPGTAPRQRTPGGDFGWLRKTYSWVNGTATETEDGSKHGHNIIAPTKGYNADPVNATAPGGTFPANQLGCNSCHNEHGSYRRLLSGTISKTGAPIWASGSYGTPTVADNEPKSTGEAVGVYRLLNGMGTVKDGVTFPGNPAAKVPSTYNRTESTTQTRVAYGVSSAGGHTTWGTWCATCHPGMHSNGNYVHPTDQGLGSTIATNYGRYVKSGDMTGSASSSYLSLVPFIENTGDYTVLASHSRNTDTVLNGPGSSDQVSCFSCHRAHASGFLHALRFDQGYEFMVVNGNYPGIDHLSWGYPLPRPGPGRGRTMAEWQAAYYDRAPSKFATYQRVLCNKCHAKD